MSKKTWRLKRTRQCVKCPWRKDVDARDIPNGYCIKKHKALECTIADNGGEFMPSRLSERNMPVMACHETEDAHCLGWLSNQAGIGNNIAVRLRLMSCENAGDIELVGEQHEDFYDTIPGYMEAMSND